MNLPEDLYGEVITSFKDYSSMSLRQVKKNIRSFCRRLKRADKIKEVNSDKIMQVQVTDQKKRTFKPRGRKAFKGICHYCGEEGHKAIDCPKRKMITRTSKNIKCFICDKNHYANKCPLRKEKVEEVNIFVEVTHLKGDEEKVMMDYDEEMQEDVEMRNGESKVKRPTMEEK